jgi:hypothetical protein
MDQSACVATVPQACADIMPPLVRILADAAVAMFSAFVRSSRGQEDGRPAGF